MPIEVKMPRLSDTMEVGTVVKWNVKPGQKVNSGDVIADIETDKATMELQTFDEGTIARLTVEEGKSVPVGTTIMVLAEAGEDVSAAEAAAGKEAPAGAAAPADAPVRKAAQSGASFSEREDVGTAVLPERSGGGKAANGLHPAPAAPQRRGVEEGERVFASPLARKLAAEANIDLGTIRGSGPSGRIVRKDVEDALAARALSPAGRAPAAAPAREPSKLSGLSAGAVPGTALPPAGAQLRTQTVALSNMRATIARRLVQSKTTVPHYQVTVSARMDALLALRQQLNDQLASQGVKLSVNDFLVRACALAMHQHPFINSRWVDKGPDGQPAIEVLGDVNIGVAIALPVDNQTLKGGGLVVATLRNADRMGLRMISQQTKALSEKARTRGLSIEEMSDSTFTISNLGMFGVDHFTAIINPPNTAILAVGAAVKKPVVEGDKIVVGHEMAMTMSSDHRVIDGAMAAAYLATVKDLLEKPATLLV